jgi:hypothetical protein
MVMVSFTYSLRVWRQLTPRIIWPASAAQGGGGFGWVLKYRMAFGHTQPKMMYRGIDPHSNNRVIAISGNPA